jgi:hypothetical protein
MSSQLELFHVQEAYAKADKPLSNEELTIQWQSSLESRKAL